MSSLLAVLRPRIVRQNPLAASMRRVILSIHCAAYQNDAQIAHIGLGRAGLDESAGLLEEGVCVVAAEEISGVEGSHPHLGDDFRREDRPRGIGGAIFAVGAARKKD